MRMVDIIHNKRIGGELTREELEFFVQGVTGGSIPDYQMSALLMAICFRSMTAREIADLTDLMAHSGEMVDLSPIDGFKVDKHSTGGVGDKTTLVVAPVAAACGVRVAKMSGRGLGHTGGTIDKLEAIPGFRTALSPEEFFEAVRRAGLAVVGQSGNLAPADKKLYALRDVTDTVESIPLIASSIMSKKLASGADGIVLDVKTGSGALMKTLEDSIALAKTMVEIGEHNGRRTVALITDMDRPLGTAIGNAVEVAEAADTLRGHGPGDLTAVSIELAANMVFLAGKRSLAECREQVYEAIASGAAFGCLKRMVEAQGGDSRVLDDSGRFPQARERCDLTADRSGFLLSTDTEAVGAASMMLGAGRETKDSVIDPAAGILIRKKAGDRVERGEPLATLLTDRPETLDEAQRHLRAAIRIGQEPPKKVPLVYARISKDGIERYDG